jgi:conjugative relaxase-like TrwC/TraI family protein
VTLSVKKILAGRGAVNYYLEQTRRGLADYYLGERTSTDGDGATGQLAAPGAAWWGGGAETLELRGPVERGQFVPLYAKGVRPDGGYLGRRFRTQEDAAAARAERLAATEAIVDPYERWQARQRLARSGPQASVAAWDATFSPVKSVSLLWAAGDRHIQHEVWAAHCAAVDAGLGYLEQHAGFVRAGRNGIRVLDTDGLVVARMNEWTSRDGDMQLHTHCLILNRARTTTDGKWRALDGRALLAARTGAAALYHRVLEAELTRRLQVAWRHRPEGLRELDGVPDELIMAFSMRRRTITAEVDRLAAAYQDRYGTPPPPAVRHRMAQDATITTRRNKRETSPRRLGTPSATAGHRASGAACPRGGPEHGTAP